MVRLAGEDGWKASECLVGSVDGLWLQVQERLSHRCTIDSAGVVYSSARKSEETESCFLGRLWGTGIRETGAWSLELTRTATVTVR